MVGLGVGKNNKLIIGVEKNIFLGYRSKQKKAPCIKHDAFLFKWQGRCLLSSHKQ